MNLKSTFIPVLLLFASLALLVPGVSEPMLTITATMEKEALKQTGIDILAESITGPSDGDEQAHERAKDRVKSMIEGVTQLMGLSRVEGSIEAYQKTRSIIGTVEDLYHSNNLAVAFLVVFFSVVIPTIKLLMMLAAITMKQSIGRARLTAMNSLMSKWSMADVFVVAMIVTYMAANATSANGGLLEFNSSFESGFYYFCGYCLFAIGASQWMHYSFSRQTQSDDSVTEQPANEAQLPAPEDQPS